MQFRSEQEYQEVCNQIGVELPINDRLQLQVISAEKRSGNHEAFMRGSSRTYRYHWQCSNGVLTKICRFDGYSETTYTYKWHKTMAQAQLFKYKKSSLALTQRLALSHCLSPTQKTALFRSKYSFKTAATIKLRLFFSDNAHKFTTY